MRGLTFLVALLVLFSYNLSAQAVSFTLTTGGRRIYPVDRITLVVDGGSRRVVSFDDATSISVTNSLQNIEAQSCGALFVASVKQNTVTGGPTLSVAIGRRAVSVVAKNETSGKADIKINGAQWGYTSTESYELFAMKMARCFSGSGSTLSVSGNTLSISGGNAITMYTTGAGISASGGVITNTGDLSNTNELQNLNASGNTLSISGGNTITMYTTGAGISSSGGVITNTGDLSNTNELQNLSLVGRNLNISGGTGVVLPVTNISAGSNVTVTSTNGDFTINATNAGFTPGANAVNIAASEPIYGDSTYTFQLVTNQLRDSSGFEVASKAALKAISTTLKTGDRVNVKGTGAVYRVYDTAITGYTSDDNLSIALASGKIALLQPVGNAFLFSQAQDGVSNDVTILRKLLSYAEATIIQGRNVSTGVNTSANIATSGTILIDRDITLTDTIVIPDDITLLGNFSFANDANYKSQLVTININNASRNAISLPTDADYHSGRISGLRFKVTSPCNAIFYGRRAQGEVMYNVMLNGGGFAKYGIWNQTSIFCNYTNVRVQEVTDHGLYLEDNAPVVSTSTEWNNCTFTICGKNAVYLGTNSITTAFFRNCYFEETGESGVVVKPQNRAYFNGCGWEFVPKSTTTATYAALIESPGTGLMSGIIEVNQSNMGGNRANVSIPVYAYRGGYMTQVEFRNNVIGGCDTTVSIISNVRNFRAIGNQEDATYSISEACLNGGQLATNASTTSFVISNEKSGIQRSTIDDLSRLTTTQIGIGLRNPISSIANTATQITDGFANGSTSGINWNISNGNYVIATDNSSSTNGNGWLHNSPAGTGRLLHLRAGGVTRFLANAAGTVGINTSAPSAALDVVGDLEVSTRTGTATSVAGWAADNKAVNVALSGLTLLSGTLSATDASISNEGQLSVGAGSANGTSIGSNTSGASAILIYGQSGISITENTSINGGEINIANTGDLDVSNEGRIGVGAGTSSSSTITTNTAGSNAVNLIVGAGLSISEATSINGGDITITNTGDTDASNDLTTSTNFAGDISGVWNNLQIGVSAVTSTEIATDAVIASKIANGSVTSSKIANNAVSTPAIVDDAITMAKISQAGATDGQIIKWNGADWGPASQSDTTFKYESPGAGTFTIPSGAKALEVWLQGGGGGGGGGRRGAAGSVRCGGGGGGAGATSFEKIRLQDLSFPSSIYFEVGAGGTAGLGRTSDDTNGGNGGNGGETFIALTSGSDKLQRAVGGSGASGGSATSGVGGNGGVGVEVSGGAGAAASTTGAAGSSGASSNNTRSIGGGSGGGITTADAASQGGTGNAPFGSLYTGSAQGSSGGGNGANAADHARGTFSSVAGAGGGSSITGDAGAGGNGIFGSGGGGGGAALNGTGASGAGGAGGAGRIWITVIY